MEKLIVYFSLKIDNFGASTNLVGINFRINLGCQAHFFKSYGCLCDDVISFTGADLGDKNADVSKH